MICRLDWLHIDMCSMCLRNWLTNSVCLPVKYSERNFWIDFNLFLKKNVYWKASPTHNAVNFFKQTDGFTKTIGVGYECKHTRWNVCWTGSISSQVATGHVRFQNVKSLALASIPSLDTSWKENNNSKEQGQCVGDLSQKIAPAVFPPWAVVSPNVTCWVSFVPSHNWQITCERGTNGLQPAAFVPQHNLNSRGHGFPYIFQSSV